jgi:asparagine N-glycosylation enzyme membrane subunit Stt3
MESNAMQILIYLFAASFVFMAVALMITYKRTRHYGVFLLGLTYAASAVLAVVLMHWWPLVAGFALVWVLRFLGLDPDVKKNDNEQSIKE